MIFEGQLDIFELLEAAEARAPQAHMSAGTFMVPGDLEAMFEKKEAHHREFSVTKGNWKPYQGWGPCATSGHGSPHWAQSFDADLRCQHYGRSECSCVGSLVYRVYCHNCDHWTDIYAHENLVWEEHLDHCWPGWRDLPVLEGKRSGFGYKFTYPDGYPEGFMIPGSPILDCRGSEPIGGKHVAGHSPFGGVKVGVLQECKVHDWGGG